MKILELYPFDEEKITNFNDLQTRVYDNIKADKTNKKELEALKNTTSLIYEVYANLLRHRKTNHTLEIDTDHLKCTITDPTPGSGRRIHIDLQFIRILNEVLIFYLLHRLYLLKYEGDMQYEPRLDIYVNAAISFLSWSTINKIPDVYTNVLDAKAFIEPQHLEKPPILKVLKQHNEALQNMSKTINTALENVKK